MSKKEQFEIWVNQLMESKKISMEQAVHDMRNIIVDVMCGLDLCSATLVLDYIAL